MDCIGQLQAARTRRSWSQLASSPPDAAQPRSKTRPTREQRTIELSSTEAAKAQGMATTVQSRQFGDPARSSTRRLSRDGG